MSTVNKLTNINKPLHTSQHTMAPCISAIHCIYCSHYSFDKTLCIIHSHGIKILEMNSSLKNETFPSLDLSKERLITKPCLQIVGTLPCYPIMKSINASYQECSRTHCVQKLARLVKSYLN